MVENRETLCIQIYMHIHFILQTIFFYIAKSHKTTERQLGIKLTTDPHLRLRNKQIPLHAYLNSYDQLTALTSRSALLKTFCVPSKNGTGVVRES